MIKNFLKIAIRHMKRHRLFTLINVTGLSSGMVCGIFLMLWVVDELSYDQFHEHKNQIYRVLMEIKFGDSGRLAPVTPPALAPAMAEQFSEVLSVARYLPYPKQKLAWGRKRKYAECAFVDPSFLTMFSFPLVRGDSSTVLTDPLSAVLTEGMAEKIFGDEDPMGQIIALDNRHDIKVTGILKDVPRQSHLDFEVLIPLQFATRLDEDIETWDEYQFHTYVILRPESDIKDLARKVAELMKQRTGWQQVRVILESLTDIRLRSATSGGIRAETRMGDVYMLSSVGFLILFIAGMNFINLSTATASLRAKEIGMRKTVGARRIELIRQLLGESFLIVLISFVFAMIMVLLFLPVFSNLAGKPFSAKALLDGRIVLGLIGMVTMTGFLSGIHPALVQSSLEPVTILSGSTMRQGKRTSRARLRKVLVVLQFIISISLIVCVSIVFRQLQYIKSGSFGAESGSILNFSMEGEMRRRHAPLKSALQAIPGVEMVTMSSSLPISIRITLSGFDWEGRDPERRIRFNVIYVDPDFMDTYGLCLKDGRWFKDTTADLNNFIVNETAIREMGQSASVGIPFRHRISQTTRQGRLIGVVQDFHNRSFREEIRPLVFMVEPRGYRFVTVLFSPSGGRLSEKINAVRDVFRRFDADRPFDYRFLDDTIDRMYRPELRLVRLLRAFAFFAVIISCAGLFSLATFAAASRTKEIGIRKVLGASSGRLYRMLCLAFFRYVGIAMIVAWPLSYYLMRRWLNQFAYRTSMTWWIFVLSGFLAMGISILTVSYQSIRAARANPVDSLRYE